MDRSLRFKGGMLLALSFVIALSLMLLPLPHWALWYRPDWLCLTLIYWIFELPQRVGIFIAWVLGIILDVLNNTVLGTHAFAFIILAYLCLSLHLRIRVYPLMQQALSIFILLMIYHAILFLLFGMLGQAFSFWMIFLPALSSSILWPWVSYLLRDYQRKYLIV